MGFSPCFVVDGLDRIGRSADVHEAFVAVLRVLAETGALIVTCRTEVWQDDFAQLSVHPLVVDELPAERVAALLGGDATPADVLPILRVPFFLDAHLRTRHLQPDVPRSMTDILAGLWRSYQAGPQDAVPRRSEAAAVLRTIAELQLDAMAFVVPLDALRTDLPAPATALDLAELTNRRIVVRTSGTDRPGVRLRHDLLDCFGMAMVLLDAVDGAGRRATVYRRAAEDVGWQLIAMLVQLAHDRGREQLLDEVFTELLGMLDRKADGVGAIPDSWAATYVLREKFDLLLPRILRCLNGRKVVAGPGGGRSSAGRDPSVTRESASTLASAFAVITDWRSARPDEAIEVLAANLAADRWPGFRRRFVEALGQYVHPRAVAALEELLGAELDLLDGADEHGENGENAPRPPTSS
ncbi:hypothetical protein [Pseudonocardia humida]|uniref:KAP-like P-loop domain-containing protein n=1 Tax=Pseudonocardia humida TaxID=2800819 RepID=A0ABT1A2A8_9PSEU|nr:hypothetical protein [Pseudonocardia humida]MCO1657127.1 hypothetical protein [Pseudonocardia humida]